MPVVRTDTDITRTTDTNIHLITGNPPSTQHTRIGPNDTTIHTPDVTTLLSVLLIHIVTLPLTMVTPTTNIPNPINTTNITRADITIATLIVGTTTTTVLIPKTTTTIMMDTNNTTQMSTTTTILDGE